MIIIKTYKTGYIPVEIFQTVAMLLHDAFEERRRQNIKFHCGSFTASDVEDYMKPGGYLLVAFDDDTPVGTLTLLIRTKRGLRYGAHDNLAVASRCKGKGVATKIFDAAKQLAESEHLGFLSSTTATVATSSVNYHKKVGFLVYKISHGADYDAYNYILPLRKLRWLRCELIRKSVVRLTGLSNRIKQAKQ